MVNHNSAVTVIGNSVLFDFHVASACISQIFTGSNIFTPNKNNLIEYSCLIFIKSCFNYFFLLLIRLFVSLMKKKVHFKKKYKIRSISLIPIFLHTCDSGTVCEISLKACRELACGSIFIWTRGLEMNYKIHCEKRRRRTKWVMSTG